MKNLDLIKLDQKKQSEALQQAFKENDADKFADAWVGLTQSIKDEVMQDFEQYKETKDTSILVQRGIRQLTTQENKYYQSLITALKSNDPKQALTNLQDVMPETIITDVFKDLIEEHPLLAEINFQNTSYTTTWVLNDHSKQTCAWGDLTDEIKKEISSGFKKIHTNMYKLSAFLVIDKSMLDLGPTWLDSYVRTILKESSAAGLENGIVNGTGKQMPIGLNRSVAKGVSVTDGVYPEKTAIAVKSFTPKEYGSLLAKMAVTEDGRNRKFTQVLMVVNQMEYLTKIMPATTVQNTLGGYVTDIFPFPTKVIISNEVKNDRAIVFIPKEYFFGLGTIGKDGMIQYDDSYKFLEDQRTFLTKLYGYGRMFDDTCSLMLDISGLDEAYITVKNKS